MHHFVSLFGDQPQDPVAPAYSTPSSRHHGEIIDSYCLKIPPGSRDELHQASVHTLNLWKVSSKLSRIAASMDSGGPLRRSGRASRFSCSQIDSPDLEAPLPRWAQSDPLIQRISQASTDAHMRREKLVLPDCEDAAASRGSISSFTSYEEDALHERQDGGDLNRQWSIHGSGTDSLKEKNPISEKAAKNYKKARLARQQPVTKGETGARHCLYATRSNKPRACILQHPTSSLSELRCYVCAGGKARASKSSQMNKRQSEKPMEFQRIVNDQPRWLASSNKGSSEENMNQQSVNKQPSYEVLPRFEKSDNLPALVKGRRSPRYRNCRRDTSAPSTSHNGIAKNKLGYKPAGVLKSQSRRNPSKIGHLRETLKRQPEITSLLKIPPTST